MNLVIDPKYNPVPSLTQSPEIAVAAAAAATGAVAVWVTSEGELPQTVELSREELKLAGFTGAKGQTYVLPGEPVTVLVGIGKGVKNAAEARNAVAAFVRAASKEAEISFDLETLHRGDTCARGAARAAVEGALLARYAYEELKTERKLVPLTKITMVATADTELAQEGIAQGVALSRAARLSRDLANTPPRHLTATKLAEVVAEVGPQFGLEVEVFDLAKIQELRLEGVLGVNAGSVEEPRVIKLSYKPENARAHVGLVGKGIMYDSGGISLKPSDPSHCIMKMDMMGAVSLFGAMTALADLKVDVAVTGFMMCTDNMPSGSATKLGDVLTYRNGKTAEVKNTDAEGRLVLADGLVLATELEPRPDALVDIATLTGAALMAFGTETTAVMGNNQDVVDQLIAAGAKADDVAWQMPLDLRLKETMKSNIADFANIGAREGGAITAALFLNEFVDGTPWGHLDIAGTMEATSDKLWRSAGATGVGARTLAHFLAAFKQPSGDIIGTELD